MQGLERKLGFTEAYFGYLHRFAGTVVIRDMLLIKGRVTADAVRAAFRALRDRHPLLDARICASPQGLHFVRDHGASGDPLEIRTWDASQDPDEVYEDADSSSFNDGDLLYKFVFLLDPSNRNHVLVSAFHHSISDALSVNAICVELTRYLDAYLNDEPLGGEAAYRFPPSIDSLFANTPRWQFVRLSMRSLCGSVVCPPPRHERERVKNSMKDRAKARNVFFILTVRKQNKSNSM